jgi:hypothetical protein
MPNPNTTVVARRRQASNGNGAQRRTTPVSNRRSWQEHAMLVREAWDEVGAGWRQSSKGIHNTSIRLKDANRELEPADFEKMLNAADLGFMSSAARKIICIASNEILCAHVHILPPHWGTQYELSKVDDAILRAAIEDGTVNPEMSRQEAMNLQSDSTLIWNATRGS